MLLTVAGDAPVVAVATSDGGWRIERDGRYVTTVWDAATRDAVVAAQTRLALAESATDVVVLHASGVLIRGRVLVLPGMSGTGKSTLAAALVAAGAQPFADEYIALDKAARAHPWPAHCAVRLGGVLLTRYADGEPESSVRLDRAVAVAEVLVHAFTREGDVVLQVLHHAAEVAPIWRGTRTEAASAAENLLRTVPW